MQSAWHTVWRSLFSLLLLAHAGAAPSLAADPGKPLPAPTGKMAVGRVTFFWTDNSRPEVNTPDENDKRQLRVDVWYPCQASNDATRAPYFADLAALNKQLGPEAILLGAIGGHALSNPPLAASGERYPTLLFSPGLGMNAVQYAATVEELASHGYVVATVDHPGQSKAVAYPDGHVIVQVNQSAEEVARLRDDPEKYARDYRERIEVRAADLRFVLDQLQRLNAGSEASGDEQKFAGRLDLLRVGVIGHSIGGITAAEAAIDDPRFKAVVNLDGHARSLTFLPDADGNGPRQPFAELTDKGRPPTDQDLARMKMGREEFNRQMALSSQRANGGLRTIAGGSFRVTIDGVRHQSFSDMAVWDPGTPDERNRRMQIIRDYVRAFFDKTLRGWKQTLLDAEASPYSEATVERFEPVK